MHEPAKKIPIYHENNVYLMAVDFLREEGLTDPVGFARQASSVPLWRPGWVIAGLAHRMVVMTLQP